MVKATKVSLIEQIFHVVFFFFCSQISHHGDPKKCKKKYKVSFQKKKKNKKKKKKKKKKGHKSQYYEDNCFLKLPNLENKFQQVAKNIVGLLIFCGLSSMACSLILAKQILLLMIMATPCIFTKN
jgi:hypothetical protein